MDDLVGPVGVPRDAWSAVVVGVGLATALGYTWNLLRELAMLSVTLPPVVVFLLGLLLSGCVVYAGGRLAASGFDTDQRRSVTVYGAVGSALLVAITALSILVRSAEGRPVGEPLLVLLVNLDAGMVAGVGAGWLQVVARRERDEAEQARDTLAFLNRTLRHEVLNSVQLVEGHAELLAEEAEGETAAVAETVVESNEDLADRIEGVRQVADVLAGAVDQEPIRVADVAERVATWARDVYPGASVTVAADDDAVALATDAVEHALRNLVANGIEHNDRAAPTVDVTVERTEGSVRVRVADDGPGVPDERKGEILEPRAGGTHGFGLHLVKTLVDGYGGSLEVADNEPRGAVFVVTLPAADGR